MAERLLEVEDLHVSFNTEEGVVKAVDGVSFGVDSGEVLAVVGESGCGKSVTAMTLMGLTRSPNARFEGSAKLAGTELVTASNEELQRIRGAQIAMIFQDPMTSLDPVYRVGSQIVEQIRAHDKEISKAAAFDRAVELMERVGIPDARERARSQELQRDGSWVHLWRVAGRYPNVSVFDVGSPDELHELLSSLPLFPYIDAHVTALARHPSKLDSTD